MEKKIYDIDSKELGKITLNDALFGREVKNYLIYEKIKCELANQRLGTAQAKTRGEVRGGGKKPWKQKGTGRARAGSIRSPLWVGGGVVFGPRKRDYGYDLPKKLKRLAMATTIAFKFQEKEVVKIVKDFTIESGKTKDAYRIIKNLNEGKEERTVVIFLNEDEKLKRALRNIPWVSYLSAKRLAAHPLFYARHVIIMESAVKYIEEQYSNFLGINN